MHGMCLGVHYCLGQAVWVCVGTKSHSWESEATCTWAGLLPEEHTLKVFLLLVCCASERHCRDGSITTALFEKVSIHVSLPTVVLWHCT